MKKETIKKRLEKANVTLLKVRYIVGNYIKISL